MRLHVRRVVDRVDQNMIEVQENTFYEIPDLDKESTNIEETFLVTKIERDSATCIVKTQDGVESRRWLTYISYRGKEMG